MHSTERGGKGTGKWTGGKREKSEGVRKRREGKREKREGER
jgi:hypothetical protein